MGRAWSFGLPKIANVLIYTIGFSLKEYAYILSISQIFVQKSAQHDNKKYKQINNNMLNISLALCYVLKTTFYCIFFW